MRAHRGVVMGEACWTWRRPTLPRLETQYHGRGRVSRPSSGWDRVGHLRCGHQVEQASRPPRAAEGAAGGGGWRAGRRHGSDAVVAGGVEVDRAIRTGKLHALPRVHIRPIDVVVYHGSSARPGLEVGFPLRCLQRLSRPNLATRLCRWRDNRSTRGSSTPVLSY